MQPGQTACLLVCPLRQAASVYVSNGMGVGLDSLFFKVSHKSMARLWRQDVCQEVSVEEDALQAHKKDEDTGSGSLPGMESNTNLARYNK